jgi:hypothetical protein
MPKSFVRSRFPKERVNSPSGSEIGGGGRLQTCELHTEIHLALLLIMHGPIHWTLMDRCLCRYMYLVSVFFLSSSLDLRVHFQRKIVKGSFTVKSARPRSLLVNQTVILSPASADHVEIFLDDLHGSGPAR